MPDKPNGELHRFTGSWGSVEVHELGATVMSWRPGGSERIFVSSAARPASGQMWHGGIPVCAPWFGRPAGWAAPFKHGLVSRVPWRLVQASGSDDSVMLQLRTDGAATAHLAGAERFPADLAYTLTLRADARALALELTIASPSREALLEAVFHPYLRLAPTGARAVGLGGVAFHDYADGTDGVESDALGLAQHLDRVYDGSRTVTVSDAAGRLSLSSAGTRSMVIWNPGPGGGEVPGDEWRRFASVECGNIGARAVQIPAGGLHRQTMTLKLA